MTDVAPEQLGQVTELLADLGYSAEVADGETIRVRTGGVPASISLYADQSLSLSCSVDGGDEVEFPVALANQANAEHRFCRFSVEDGNKLRLDSDFIFQAEAPDARAQLERIMTIWDAAIGALKDLVRKALQPA